MMKNRITLTVTTALILATTSCYSKVKNVINTPNSIDLSVTDTSEFSKWQGQYYFENFELDENNGRLYGAEFTISYDEGFGNNDSGACRLYANGYQVFWNNPCELRKTANNNIVSVYDLKRDKEYAQLKREANHYYINMIHYSEAKDGFEPVEKINKHRKNQQPYPWQYDEVQTSELLTKNSLTCNLNSTSYDLAFIYWLMAETLSLNNYDATTHSLQFSPNQRIMGVKNFSKAQEKNDNVIINKSHLDIDLAKFGVHALRLSQLTIDGIEFSEYDGSGYYYVLKGLPEYNKLKLAEHGIILDKSTQVEQTTGGNTRLTCIIAG